MTRIIALFALVTVLPGAAFAQSETPSPPAPSVCDGKNLPMKFPDGSNGVPVKCCLGRDDVMVHEGRGAQNLAFRLRGTPCTKEDHSACTIPGASANLCEFGPCGAERGTLIVGTEQHVFKPRHTVKTCGWQIKLQPSSGGVDQFALYPESFDTQVEYPKVTPSCPYTACIAQHRPAISVSVTVVENQATGKVKSDPPGISLAGAGTAQSFFADPVKLSANPSEHARAVFSGGGCSATGNYGETIHCNVPLAPDPAVTVTFECKPGENCHMQ